MKRKLLSVMVGLGGLRKGLEEVVGLGWWCGVKGVSWEWGLLEFLGVVCRLG